MVERPPCSNVEIKNFNVQNLSEIMSIEGLCFEPKMQYSELVFLEYVERKAIFRTILCEGNIVGYSIADVENSTCHIVSIAILPEYRNIGLGSLLLKDCLSECCRRGAKRAILEVMVGNKPAIRMYLKFGFRIVGFIRGYYRCRDAYLMAKELVERV
ncbi:MAG: GNAT family N-acetyltransferase [Desulfurococcaceae archaeon]